MFIGRIGRSIGAISVAIANAFRQEDSEGLILAEEGDFLIQEEA